MRFVFVVSVVACALAFADCRGCGKKDAPAAPPNPEESEDVSEPEPEPGEPIPSAEPAPEPGVEAPPAEPLPQPSAAGQAMLQSQTVDEMGKYIERLADVLERSAAEPAKAAEAVESYIRTNGQRLAELRANLEEMKSRLSPEDLRAVSRNLVVKLENVMTRMMNVFAEHPELVSDPRIRAALDTIRSTSPVGPGGARAGGAAPSEPAAPAEPAAE